MRWIVFSLLIAGCAAHEPPKLTFGSPEETFESWRSAVDRLDVEGLLACYADAAKDGIRREIQGSSKGGLEAMQEEAKDTDFKIEKIIYEGNKAYVRVKRSRGPIEDIEVLTMILERGGWKLVP